MNLWTDELTFAEIVARNPRNAGHYAYAVEQGGGYCRARKAGAWDANNAESFAAYAACERAALAAAA